MCVRRFEEIRDSLRSVCLILSISEKYACLMALILSTGITLTVVLTLTLEGVNLEALFTILVVLGFFFLMTVMYFTCSCIVNDCRKRIKVANVSDELSAEEFYRIQRLPMLPRRRSPGSPVTDDDDDTNDDDSGEPPKPYKLTKYGSINMSSPTDQFVAVVENAELSEKEHIDSGVLIHIPPDGSHESNPLTDIQDPEPNTSAHKSRASEKLDPDVTSFTPAGKLVLEAHYPSVPMSISEIHYPSVPTSPVSVPEDSTEIQSDESFYDEKKPSHSRGKQLMSSGRRYKKTSKKSQICEPPLQVESSEILPSSEQISPHLKRKYEQPSSSRSFKLGISKMFIKKKSVDQAKDEHSSEKEADLDDKDSSPVKRKIKRSSPPSHPVLRSLFSTILCDLEKIKRPRKAKLRSTRNRLKEVLNKKSLPKDDTSKVLSLLGAQTSSSEQSSDSRPSSVASDHSSSSGNQLDEFENQWKQMLLSSEETSNSSQNSSPLKDKQLAPLASPEESETTSSSFHSSPTEENPPDFT